MAAQTPVSNSADTTVTITARRGPLSGGLGLVVVVVLLSVAGYTTWKLFTAPPEPPPKHQFEEVICAVTLKHFQHERESGETFPYYSPYTKDQTAYPAETCYWTKDGKAKLEPTYVLLNEYIKKQGPTLCPDCGRLVEPHNPPPPAELMAAAQKAAASKPAAAGAANAR